MSNAALTWARKQRSMTPAAKAVLMVLADCANGERVCWPSQQVLADDSCIRRQAVPGIIAKLVEAGLISVQRTGKESRYTVLYDVRNDDNEPLMIDVREADTRSLNGGQPLSDPKTTDVRIADTNPKEPSKNPKEPKTARARGEFDRWWSGYPHKVGRQAAQAKFQIARRSASLDELTEGVRRYVESKPPDRPWCNPATWLHQGRWLDEPAATGPPANGHHASPVENLYLGAYRAAQAINRKYGLDSGAGEPPPLALLDGGRPPGDEAGADRGLDRGLDGVLAARR